MDKPEIPHAIEVATARTLPSGRYAVHLPWRKFEGVAIPRCEIDSVFEVVCRIKNEFRAANIDLFGYNGEKRLFYVCQKLASSNVAAQLLRETPPSSGSAICIRPYQLARTADGELGIILHLDTIISIECTFSEVTSEAQDAHAKNAKSLIITLKGWIQDLIKPAG